MAVHTITAKQLLSRVRQVFPDAGETYVVEDQMWYTVNDDNSGQKINKVFRVSIKDSAGEYIRVPRLLDAETLKMDLV